MSIHRYFSLNQTRHHIFTQRIMNTVLVGVQLDKWDSRIIPQREKQGLLNQIEIKPLWSHVSPLYITNTFMKLMIFGFLAHTQAP